jgi:endonuclease III
MDGTLRSRWILKQLVTLYGLPTIDPQDPLHTLVLTILSQNTTDMNRDRAYRSLMERFITLEGIRTAEPGDIASAIQVGGLQHQKALSLQGALRRIADERGALDLSFLRDLPLPDALQWLQSLPGVGPKTAGIVLLFSFGRPYFPADTHVRRVMHRMGLVPERGDPHRLLNTILPDDPSFMQQLHLLTIRLGRDICHPGNPECLRCPLRPKCVWTRTRGSAATNAVMYRPDKVGGTQ